MKLDKNSEECRQKEAGKMQKTRDKQIAENPEECRKNLQKNRTSPISRAKVMSKKH